LFEPMLAGVESREDAGLERAVACRFVGLAGEDAVHRGLTDIEDEFAMLAVQKRLTSRYLEFDDNFMLKGRVKSDIMKDKYFAFNGVHIISNEIFSVKEEVGYKDIIDIYIDKKKPVMGFDSGVSSFLDLGKTENLKVAESLID